MAETTNDCTVSFGNELTMLRIVVDVLLEWVNWLVEDLGSKTLDKMPPPNTPCLSCARVDTVMGSAYAVYMEDGNVRDTRRALIEKGIDKHIQDGVLDMDSLSNDPAPASLHQGEGRHRECDNTFPLMSADGPESSTKPPPLPDDDDPALEAAMTIQPGPTGDGNALPRNGATEGPTGKEEPHSTPNVSESTPPHDVPSDEHPPLELFETCSCYDRLSLELQQCSQCGQFFHPDCIQFVKSHGSMLCGQCVKDQSMFGSQADEATADTTLITQADHLAALLPVD